MWPFKKKIPPKKNPQILELGSWEKGDLIVFYTWKKEYGGSWYEGREIEGYLVAILHEGAIVLSEVPELDLTQSRIVSLNKNFYSSVRNYTLEKGRNAQWLADLIDNAKTKKFTKVVL